MADKGDVEAYIAAAANVARERVRYAEEWLMSRMKASSDMAATQRTIEVTADELTRAYAMLKVAEMRLNNG